VSVGTAEPKVKRKREEQLVAKAVELFSNGGYRETSLQEIADKLGIARPLFYYYFETKEELLWRIIGHLGDELLENARPVADADAAPGDKLSRLIETHVSALLTNVDAFRIYFAERHLVKGARHRRLNKGETAYQDLICAVIVEGQRSGEFRDGDPATLTRLLTGMANSTTRWYSDTGTLSIEELSRVAAECATAAVRA
jgi:TetR/AcrR family transcriptional regulator, cholesterol catabolism regulator